MRNAASSMLSLTLPLLMFIEPLNKHLYTYTGTLPGLCVHVHASVHVQYYKETLKTLTLFKMISGATYSGVPQKVHVLRPGPITFANPKSTCRIQRKPIPTLLLHTAPYIVTPHQFPPSECPYTPVHVHVHVYRALL